MKIIPKFAFVVGFLVAATLLNALPIVQEWYVPQPEAQLRTDYLVLAPDTNSTCDSVIALTVPIVGTKIVFDHWEDGYEVDLGNPVQSTTQIWGDGNDANGKPPGYANDPVSFSAGSVITLRNNVPLPRNAATILYDGRDRLGSTYGIVMTRAGWFTTPGPLLANSIEVRAVPDWGTSFELPIGEDYVFPSPATSSMFEHCSAYIQAAANGTVVTIDVDGGGAAAPFNVTLNQGESYLVNSGIKTQATINSTKPIQVIEFFGDIGANYESRGANIPPLSKWSDDYYAPVGTASDGDDTYIFLHNPDDSVAITINWVTKTGTGSFSIPAEGTYRFTMPQDSAARFTSVGEKPFWGIGTVGAEPTANNVHDWGYSLVPKDFLSTEIVVGWGAGSDDGTQNGSPVWVTTIGSTKLYVDYNGDRLGSLTDPNGSKYDYAVDVTPMTVTRLFDPDKNQSGMRIYTLNGVLLTGAWGQDPATAGPARPYLDLGNTLPNFPVPVLAKTSSLYTDVNGNGIPNIGDTLEYTLTLDNRSLFSLSAIGIVDALPTSFVSYVTNSTTRDGAAVADSVSGTAFPLDADGLFVPILQSKASTVIKFRVTITAAGTAVNAAQVVGSPGVEASNTVVIPTGGSFTTCTIKLTNNSGTEIDYTIGDGVYVQVTDPDTNSSASTVETLTAVVTNTTTLDTELITLTETGVNTGIFINSAPLPTSTSIGLGPNDGTLNVAAGTTISASRLDPVFGDTCSDTATVTASSGLSKQLYLDTDGADNDTTGDLDRVSPAEVSPADVTLSSTEILTPAVSSTSAFSTAGTTTWTVPTGVTAITVKAWGGGGAGGGSTNAGSLTARGGAGGGGGAYSSSVLSVTPGQELSVTVAGTAAGGAGATGNTGSPSFVGPDANSNNAYVRAAGGSGGTGNTSGGTPTGGAGGTVANSVGTTRTAGTAGGNGATGFGISSGAGGTGAAPNGGAGGAVVTSAGSSANGNPGVAPGGGGGGSRTSQDAGNRTGGAGGAGRVEISYDVPATSVTFTQTPSFAEAFSVTGAPSVTAYYTVTSGTMPGSPSISAVLRKNGTAFATSNSTTASGGLLTFGFPSSPTSFAATDVISLVITNNQTGVTFTVDYDSNTKPSKITLPTNTVIHADTVAVYDAPYPGGSVVATPTVGQTLYVRATIGDPFGYADVTSASLVIDGATTSAGDIASTPMTPVAGSGANRTFEYVWVTGATEDNFSLTVTANEGYENTITSTKATTIPLTALDLGTPSITEFTTGNNGPHTLTYAPNETIYVRVTDLDENTDPLVAETITVVILGSGGDEETVTLTETGPNTGIFTGGIPASSTVSGSDNNGTLYAVLGSVPVVNYVDNDDPSDTGSDTALIPNTVANVSVIKTLLTDSPIVVGEAVQYRLRVTNTGNTTLNTVQVVDTYPSASLTYVSASPSPDSSSAGTLTWTNIGPLVSGQSADIIVNFTGSAAAAPAINSVDVTTGGGPTASDTEPVTITRPEVTVTKTLDGSTPGPVNKGSNVVFNISVQNTGTTAIASLPLEDLFSDALFEYVSASPTPDGVGAGSLLWNDLTGAGSLAVGATIPVTVTLKAKGASTNATNLAAVNYAEDENGDAVPPDDDPADVETRAASISGYVFEDLGSPGGSVDDGVLSGVTVVLYSDPNADDDPSDGVVLAVTTTDSNGYYEFLNLPLGEYVVVEQDPLGYLSVADTQGAPTDNWIGVNVIAFTSYPDRDFLDILVNPDDFGSISGQVRDDVDADAAFADAESGLAGAVVTLYTDPNGDGDPSDGVPYGAPVTTTSSGNYSFTIVPPGFYVIVETDPAGYVSTADVSNPNNNQIPITVAASSVLTGKDFLDTSNTSALGMIGNQVWSDADNDGVFDVGESGIEGLDVYLYLSTQTPGVDQPYLTTTTAPDGTYQFTNVPAGTYVVALPTPPANAPLSSTITPTGDNNDNGLQAGGVDTRVVTSSFTLTAGGTDNSKDLGLVPLSSLVALGNRIFNDLDGDGILDSGETGIASVTVQLYMSGDTPGVTTPMATTATDASGYYYFDHLVPGTYFVYVPPVEFQTGGTLQNFENSDGTSGSDGRDHGVEDEHPETNGIRSTEIALAAGSMPTGEDSTGYLGSVADANSNFTLDLAFVPLSSQTTIGDLVFADLNNDGNLDPGESGINGVTVELWIVGIGPGGTDVLHGTTVTSTLEGQPGRYLFVHPPNTISHYVKIPSSNFSSGGALAGYPRSSSGVGTANNDNHGTQAAGPRTDAVAPNIAPIAGETNLLQDFGFVPVSNLVAFGDRIFKDIDGDGSFDNDTDEGISGVVVHLYAQGQTAGVDTPMATASTSATGYLYFDNLVAGNYFLHVPASEFGTGEPLDGFRSSIGYSADVSISGDNQDHGIDDFNPALNGISTPVVILSVGNEPIGEDDTNYTGSVPDANASFVNDFGFVPPASLGTISGTVRLDTTGDTAADGYLVGATVSLYYDMNLDGIPDGEAVATTVSDASGAYSFVQLPPGSYVVIETDPAGYYSVSDGDTTVPSDDLGNTTGLDNRIPVTLIAGETDGGNDFLDRGLATIGNRVWLDENSDGVQDAGEAGIGNLVVQLSGTDANGNAISRITVTDVDGYYIFPALPPSNGSGYTVTVTPLSGMTATYNEDTGTTTPNHATTVVLPAGGEHLSADFGYNWATTANVTGGTGLGAIGDRVWIDADGDGMLDLGEAGLGGITVQIYYDSNSDGSVDALYTSAIDHNGNTGTGTTTTLPDGSYVFRNLPAGIYEIRLPSPPASYTQTGDPDGVADNKTTFPIVLAPGDVFVNADFGYQPNVGTSGTVSGTIWLDADADQTGPLGTPGGADTSEITLAGITVALIKDLDGDGLRDPGEPVIARTITDASGSFIFSGLPVADGDGTDDYLVWLTDVNGINSGGVPTYDFDGLATLNTSPATNLATTGNDLQDFGYHTQDSTPTDGGFGGIGDTIFLDRDGDGLPGYGEGLEGVTVWLYDATGSTLLASFVTNEEGNYYFNGLTDGTYLIRVDTTTLPGTSGQLTNTTDPDNGGAASESVVVLLGSPINMLQDFGYRDLTLPNSIGGTIWNDLNADGSLSGELVVYAGVTVSLLDSDGNIVASTVTDSGGNYLFSGVPDGSFTVDVTDTEKILNGLWHSSGSQSVATDNTSKNPPYNITVSGGQVVTTVDFGYYSAAAGLGNYVWNDLDLDGVQDVGEPGIPGVVVELTITWPGGGITKLTSTTDASGFYTFNNLLLDEHHDGVDSGEPTYSIIIPSQPSADPSLTGQGTSATDSNDPSGTTATVTEGSVNDSYDFGFEYYWVVSGTVYDDGGNNTTGDGGFGGTPVDSGLEGVTVKLYRDVNNDGEIDNNDVLVATTTTGSGGSYAFSDVPAGDYLILETDPVGFTSLTDIDGNSNGANLIAVTVTTENEPGNDFLDLPPACPNLWADWQTKWSSAPYNIPGGDLDYTDNPDGDRYDNLAEYAFCMPPNSGVKKPFCLEPSLTVSGGIDGVFRRTAGGTNDVVYTLERTASLGNPTDWTTIAPITLNAGNTTVTVNADGTETVRIIDLETLTGLTGEGYVRMRATIGGDSATTEVLGWKETSLNQTCSTFNNPFLRCATFTGTVSSVSGQNIVFSGENFVSLLESGEKYYLEVTSGDHEGHRFDVVSASGTNIVVENDSDLYAATAPFNTFTGPPPSTLAGATVVLRRHWKLGIQFPVSTSSTTGFVADTTAPLNNAPDADQIQLYTDGAWVTYYVYDADGAGGAAPFWTLLGGAVADMEATVLPPGQGMFVSRPNPTIQMLSYGEVRENQFIRPLQAGATPAKHNNLVGGGFPYDQSATDLEDSPTLANSRAMTLSGVVNNFFGSRDFKTADSFFIWKGDTTGTTAGYDSYYLLSRPDPDGAGPLPTVLKWVIVGDALLDQKDGDVLFKSDRSVFIRVASELPVYTIPCPWTNP